MNIEKDIYTKDGRLLLAAGKELTEEVRLRLLTYKELDETLYADIIKYTNIKNSSDQIRERLKINNERAINAASEIVIRIIFGSKNLPWGLHINTLSNYVDWLYSHSINVSIISTIIAAALDLKNELENIALGAFLHDIGKLMIPKNILQKDGVLTNDELYYVRQHCDLGYSMVTGNNMNQICLDIIQQHHERLDGSGYPLGLQDAQIPIHSRIVMIADILDAITSFRPFRPARNMESAVDELKKDPTKYPQDIIDTFYRLVEK